MRQLTGNRLPTILRIFFRPNTFIGLNVFNARTTIDGQGHWLFAKEIVRIAHAVNQ